VETEARKAGMTEAEGRSKGSVRCSSHQGGSLQDGLGDKRTCEITLASAYVLYCLSAAWSQLQMMGRSLR